MPTGPTLVNITHGKKACGDAPENLASGKAINPLSKISPMDTPVKVRAEAGLNDLADKEIKIKIGNAISTISLFDPDKSGLTRLL